MNEQKKEYLGDSVYAEQESNGIMLTTNNGFRDDPRNRIFLEPEVFAALVRFAESLKPQCARQTGRSAQAVERLKDDVIKKRRSELELIDKAAGIIMRLPEPIEDKCTIYCGQLDIDSLTREESLQVISLLGAGKWHKDVNATDPTLIDYIGSVDGIRVRLWAAAPPDTCRVIEVEEEVPATKIVRRKLVCSDKAVQSNQPNQEQ